MTTVRTPLYRPQRSNFTPRAVELFRQVQAVEDGSEAWWDAKAALCDELKLAPWQFPAIEPPGAICLLPASTAAAAWFPEAQKLYRELAALAAEGTT